jgi:ubiquinone/menaquinone biosynthesis C-methylase UbiE
MSKPNHVESWEYLGRTEPYWGVLTEERFKGDQFDAESFFGSGKKQVDRIWRRVQSLAQVKNDRALDFGCGVGRLSIPLREYFKDVVGLDVSPGMLERAKEHDTTCSIHFMLNQNKDLSCLESNSFDFILSLITLQHMRPKYSKGYIKEFLRVLKPGGVAYFQLPSESRGFSLDAILLRLPFVKEVYYELLRVIQGNTFMEMHAVKRSEVERLVRAHGGKILRVRDDGHAGPKWASYSYVVQKL